MDRRAARSGEESPDRAAEAALAAMLGDMYGGRPADDAAAPPATGEPTDGAMAQSVGQALDAEAAIAPGHIRSRVEHGWARLEGQAASAAEREAAGRTALGTEGLEGVDNRVRVRAG